MVEIRFHGRGGQGSVKASDILAIAAFAEGKEVQSFPFFGVERRGAPVTAFTRISEDEIRIHCYIYEPDVLVVLDPTLIGAVPITDRLKPNGKIIINTMRKPEDFSFPDIKSPEIYTVDCSEIALKHGLGIEAAPIVNTAILGAVASATKLVSLKSVMNAIREKIPFKKEENALAAKESYERLQD
ncbi:2-oxoacid:acceptor oxidoreductase family protein [bacterium]|nr:2-oxoacid:acceptor oxidoreductase family protein [bacterium]